MVSTAKALTPAAFAEQYIVESIWNGKFAAGTILPAERELAEIIGVTRTTLREVLQRLARDGWLTIQHGKPTKVNDIWQSATLNVLDTLITLDDEGSMKLADDLLQARTSIASIFLRQAVKNNPEKLLEVLKELDGVNNDADGYIDFDWHFHHTATRASGNPIYTLMLNGFEAIYYKLGRFYFGWEQTRKLAYQYYKDLEVAIAKGDAEQVVKILWDYGHESGELWNKAKSELKSFSELGA
ncbi:fatty acid metabolism transcriptional regulator FadR [Kangiella profundi]|uniref:Fatty acid metabolism regulator protein n=1 Tax=Kangiella profundi TaxID=1561924 RepID=A0A2K9AHD6_9GAMM|nr:fatty acid metabolism transcriptional regulator FadR [Kangiella profundi]AUD78364.1 fatty acid metabolism transcriptional regulator FadR [Kangiella profundi]GGF07356.1 fatty acid metabolism regulator protein [Kangiella profundi]